MRNISVHKHCFGCGVCVSVCARKAISMHENIDGFFQPSVDLEKCADCGLCMEVCALNGVELSSQGVDGYASWSLSPEVRKKSSSGGTGYSLAQDLFKKGYRFVGVRYNASDARAEHYIAESEEDLLQSQGSKYIQSWAQDAFLQIRKGSKYFITGTPCQIASMRKMVELRKMQDSVVLMDFFCHGVPSGLVWKKYLKELEPMLGTISSASWRDKKTGWHDSWAISLNESYNRRRSQGDIFFKFFLGDMCFNKSCYKDCRFKGTASCADIRIGDLWGRKYADNEEGVTALLALTDTGRQVLKECEDVELVPETVETVLEGQMKHNSGKPYYYGLLMRLLRTDIPLGRLYRMVQMLRIGTILKYKLHIG